MINFKDVNVGKSKITVVGAGNVGATAAFIAAEKKLGEIVLIDIVEGLGQGKALDMNCAGPVENFDSRLVGTCNWEKTAGSDVVIITSGIPRKPGMSRDDLLAKNVEIVSSVTEQAVKYSPDCFIIVVANPLDAMVYTAGKVSGLDKNKIMGMAGALDSARFAFFIAEELGVCVEDIKGVLMGGHGDDMVPLPRFTTVSGIPVGELMEQSKIDELIERARKGGIEVVNLLGYSAYYAPAAGAVKMAEAILEDRKSVFSACCWCESEYGIGGYFVGVPCVLGAGGVEKVIELDLNEKEKAELDVSVDHVKELVRKVDSVGK